MATPVVTFDAGQTLIELDLDFLASRLGERGVHVSVPALRAAAPAAWDHHDARVDAGEAHPWRAFMAELLAGAGIGDAAPLVEWLWQEQPRRNLWRRPIADMVDLARELAARGVRVAVLSNSEGRLAELLEDIGLASAFAAIIDSGRVGIAKPDRRLFAHALERLGVDDARAVHIGDSWAADVEGALGAGWGAIWYRTRGGVSRDPRVPLVRDAPATRAALAMLGI